MINLAKDIKPISYIKAHTADVFKQIDEKRNPVVITQNGEARAVLMNVNQYQTIMDAIHLLKILSIGENDVKNGNIISDEEMDKRIAEILE
jgi:PHD/YefM family antitoxin component YafN of YafNO toxin-antitoxin module